MTSLGMLRHGSGVAVWALMSILLAGPAAAQLSQEEERGLAYVRFHCADCHAIGKTGTSTVAEAPAFRELHRNYPVEHLEEALAEGISTGHPAMPRFKLDPADVRDVIAYLKWLER